MRLSTLGILTAFAMSLTSATVWSMTSPDDAHTDAPPSADARASLPSLGLSTRARLGDASVDPGEPDPLDLPDESSFVAGKTLMVEGRLGNASMLADARGETFLFVDVRSDPAGLDPGSFTPEPLNLAVVIDHSGSMKGQRERNALDAAAGMIQRLRDGDTVSVVVYANEASLAVPVTTIDARSRAQILAQLRAGVASRPSGNTCISCGLDLGLETLERRRPGIDRVLLLSDGEANRGVTDERGMRIFARRARSRGVTVSSVGVDVDYNEQLMSALAREANGRHYFSETGENLEQIFDQELENLIAAVAKQGELVIELAPGVRALEVFDRSHQQIGAQVSVPMGTFSAGESKTLLMRVEVPPSPAGARPIASVALRYDDLTGSDTGECFGELAARMTTSPSEVDPLDPVVLSRLTRAETSRTLERSNALFAAGRTAEAQRVVDDHLDQLRERRKSATTASNAPGFFDPFGRDLDDDFAEQATALDSAAGGFSQAAEASAPAASREGKAQVKRNTERADAFSL
ncbi:VWA domain-containing protein [Pseudenhygromyxa sp. WMMC2535]|uniref:vWA domain-containing protein n=1 Tax=Pseudenhygromyxa sp. WMMC2535 TaxID=2712867 RepID=UPI00155589E4|nr:VWA domain-containing protein [Pseudenhygromyxa sp. WMMC2535]NVB39541.1 VWA domain-containing protein [Pseudenhygromyxa sp. WMMC2535]